MNFAIGGWASKAILHINEINNEASENKERLEVNMYVHVVRKTTFFEGKFYVG